MVSRAAIVRLRCQELDLMLSLVSGGPAVTAASSVCRQSLFVTCRTRVPRKPSRAVWMLPLTFEFVSDPPHKVRIQPQYLPDGREMIASILNEDRISWCMGKDDMI